ncbi:FMRFamide receptor-like [Watersipora subatra]|uniref:FMRFamide receptor-like n=1 Tax=Watersipora subatra TaxID=2589382 RepID=UPI00355AE97C
MDIKDNLDIALKDLCEDSQVMAAADMISLNFTRLNGSIALGAGKSFGNLHDICGDVDGYVGMITKDSNELLHQLQHYLNGIASFVVCLLGCMGNLLSIIILLDKMYTWSTNIYLLALAVADMFLLICALLISLNDIVDNSSSLSATGEIIPEAYTYPYIVPIVNIFQTISIWLMVAFTVDRYIMICHPFQGSKFCTRKRASIVVVCLYIVGVLYNLPLFFESKTEVLLEDDKKYIGRVLTELGGNDLYLKIVHLWAYSIFIFVLPCLALTVLNVRLIMAVKRSRLMGRRMSWGKTCNHRNDTTLMLVAVVVVFLVCQLPALVSNTIYASNTDRFIKGGAEYDHFRIILEISNFLVILNSAINFLLYYMFSPKFRAAVTLKFLSPCVRGGKLLVATFSQKLSYNESKLETCPALCMNQTAIDMEMASQNKTKSFVSSREAKTFNIQISCDERQLVTQELAQELLHLNRDTQNINLQSNGASKYSGISKKSRPANV